MTLRVVAHIKARSDKAAEVRELLQGLVAPTHEEPGCISYELLQSNDDPTQLTFVEEWQAEADLAAHFETPHLQAALEHLDELMAEPLDLRKYSKVG
jgi:quinol monooxygenase YgiN